LYLVYAYLSKNKNSMTTLLLKIDGALLLLLSIGGVIGAYCVPAKLYPYVQIEEGAYVAKASFDDLVYTYGAKTAFGHLCGKFIYQWATIVSNYPVAMLLILVVIGILLLIRQHDESLLICSLFLSAALGLLVLYAIASLPSEAKYDSYPILVISLMGIYLFYYYSSDFLSKKHVLTLGYLLYIIEMLCYVPNVKSFSPIWLWHDQQYNKTIRTGEMYAGETMFWGEHVAIAGNVIRELEKGENADDIVIYSNYGFTWPNNPGYTIEFVGWKEPSDLRFDDNAYYLLSKFALFRGEIPQYIYDVEPLYTIEYKGEIGAWLYRGDQLNEGYAKTLTGK